MTSLSTLARAARLDSTRKRGVTLIEAVLYISIALALIVGGLVFFQQASLAQRTNSAVRNISAIASETRGLYQSSQDFNGVTQATLINAGAVPTSIVDSAGTALQNEWTGAITVSSNAAGVTTANDSFFVVYENVPTAACSRLTSADASGAGRVGSGVVSVAFRAGNATAFVPAKTYAASASALTPSLVAGYCDTEGDASSPKGTVDLQFLFAR